MNRLGACIVGLLLTTSAANAQVVAVPQFPPAAGVPAIPQRDSAPKLGTARVRGRVIAADTGEPLRKAQVRAMSAELRESRLATTDRAGAYEFTELPAGRYQLTASKGSFVQLGYGQTRPFEPGKPLEVAEGQTIERVDFGLPRGALITGRVVDEFGEPMTDVMVSVLRYQFLQGRRQLVPAGRFGTTNDIGEYRIFGLPPGQYYLSATLRTTGPFDVSASDRSGYAATYYPGTANISEAQRLSIELGQMHSGIDVTLAPARLSRIAGTIVGSDGQPLAGGMVMLIQNSGMVGFGMSGGQVKPDGSFSILNVAPGDYTLRVMAGPGFLGPATTTPEVISTKVTVGGDDITGLRLTGTRASTVTGRIILPQAGTGAIRPGALQLTTVNDEFTLFGDSGFSGRVADDLTFIMKIQPGHHFIRLGPQTQNVVLKAVRLNGDDITDSGFDFRPNEDVSGVEVELTTEQSELSGIVTDARGQPVRDYSVVVFARDPRRWTPASRFFGGGRPDQEGRFKVRNLPAGDYYAIAVDYVEPGAGTDPEFLERVRARATEFSLTDGQVRSLDLKLVNVP